MGSEVLLECDAMPLATRYRYRRMIEGVDTTYQLVASSRTPMAMLEGVAGGLSMLFTAEAVNGGAQSVPSDPITVVTPSTAEAPVAKAAISEAELAPLAAISPNGSSNGNGSTNGNGNGYGSRPLARVS